MIAVTQLNHTSSCTNEISSSIVFLSCFVNQNSLFLCVLKIFIQIIYSICKLIQLKELIF